LSMFGTGLVAAAILRRRILDRLGAEPEWTEGDHNSADMRWTSGPVTTFFTVEPGAEATPDLGVLRVTSLVATVGDRGLGLLQCHVLNMVAMTHRWTIAPTGLDPDTEILQVSCSFVVGQDNVASLEEFALWCVREQIAIATAKLTNDIADDIRGLPVLIPGHRGGDYRDDADDWHEVVYHYDRYITSNRFWPTASLLASLADAFVGLKQEMFGEGTGAWFSADGVNEPGFLCEMPFGWDSYPAGVISVSAALGEDAPPTALVAGTAEPHPQAGKGVLLKLLVPASSGEDADELTNRLNLLDRVVPGATHSVGAWVLSGARPMYCVYLPAVLAEHEDIDIDLPVVMREMLLTLVRQALLARRVLLDGAGLADEDRNEAVGLAAPTVPHGLAWGETGEGRNPAALVLDQIYATCVGPDADWADVRTDGFRWWPYHQAQDIAAALRGASDVAQGVSIRIATEVRRGVPVTTETLRVVATMNAELGQSALVLNDDGLLLLACRLYVHEGIEHWAKQWAQILTAEQFITASEISAKLAELGEDARSGHPFSGVRPEPDELFGIRENSLTDRAIGLRAGLTPLVPLLGLCRLYSLPLQMSVADSEGGLTFTWHVSQSRAELLVDPAVRVSVRRGDVGSGPGWIIRSVVPVAGDETATAQWCNDRNFDLLADGDDSSGDRTVVGGWGLTPDGECCLTTWLSPFFVPDAVHQAAGLIGNVLSYHAGVVIAAVAADPDAVIGGHAVTPEAMADGLSSVLATFAGALEYPAGFRWSVDAGADDVVVTLAGPAAGTGSVEGVTLAEAVGSEVRTVLRVPLARNRAQLGLLYAAFLGRSVTRVKTFTNELIPGEAWEWDFTSRHIEEGLGPLDDDGLLDWDESELAFTFDAGSGKAWLRLKLVEKFRSYGGTALRLAATLPGLDLSLLQKKGARDTDILGSWNQDLSGFSYEVTIPPAGMIFGNDFIVEETLAWVGRHIVAHVRQALQGDGLARERPSNGC